MRKVATLALVWLTLTYGSIVMAEDIFIHSRNPVSGRFAILEDNDTVAFLYLTARGIQKPERDAIAYMRVPPPENVDWEEMAKKGEPPLLSRAFASSEAVLTNPSSADCSFRWAEDGEAAVLLYRGQPIALVSASEKRGHSRAAAKENPLADPWDWKLYESLFPK